MADTSTRWAAIATLLVAGLFSAAQFGKFTLTLDQLALVYGSAAGFIVSIVGIVGIMFGAVGGAHVARFGLKRAMIWALAAGAALSLMQVSLPNLPIMVALRIAEGFSHLAIVIAAPTLMSGLASNTDRPVVMGIWASFFGVALAILALVTPVLLAIGGVPAVLVFHGIGTGLMAVFVARIVPDDSPQDVQVKPFWAEHVAIYGTPRAVIAGGGFVFYTILYIALIAVLPNALEFKASQTAILPLVSLIGTFGAGYVARSVAPPAITITGFGCLIVTFIWCAVAPGLGPAIAIFLSAGLIPGACFATIPHFNATLAQRARATGAIAQLGNVGTTTGTPIFVAALMWGGLNAVFATAIVFCVVGIAVVTAIWHRCR